MMGKASQPVLEFQLFARRHAIALIAHPLTMSQFASRLLVVQLVRAGDNNAGIAASIFRYVPACRVGAIFDRQHYKVWQVRHTHPSENLQKRQEWMGGKSHLADLLISSTAWTLQGVLHNCIAPESPAVCLELSTFKFVRNG
jgi:hypothetical protein